MLRTFAACCANSGERVWAAINAPMKPSTLPSRAGTLAGSTCGAIAGACVATIDGGGAGAVRVNVLGSGGVSGAGAAADDVGSVIGFLSGAEPTQRSGGTGSGT